MLTVSIVAGACVVLVGLGLARRRTRSRHTVALERIACPRTGSDVDCTFERDASGRCEAVHSCSQWPKPHCDEACVTLLQLGLPLRPRGAGHPHPF